VLAEVTARYSDANTANSLANDMRKAILFKASALSETAGIPDDNPLFPLLGSVQVSTASDTVNLTFRLSHDDPGDLDASFTDLFLAHVRGLHLSEPENSTAP
jgi:hypothetical protein